MNQAVCLIEQGSEASLVLPALCQVRELLQPFLGVKFMEVVAHGRLGLPAVLAQSRVTTAI